MNSTQKAAIAALYENGSLSAALEALKERMGKQILMTEPHESKKREDYYTQYRLIGSLKEVFRQAMNDIED